MESLRVFGMGSRPLSRSARQLSSVSSHGNGLGHLAQRRSGSGAPAPAAPRAQQPQQAGEAEAVQPPAATPRGEALRLELDYYKLLQVPAVASRDSITTAYDRLLGQPPALGYSQATLLARGTTLKAVVQVGWAALALARTRIREAAAATEAGPHLAQVPLLPRNTSARSHAHSPHPHPDPHPHPHPPVKTDADRCGRSPRIRRASAGGRHLRGRAGQGGSW